MLRKLFHLKSATTPVIKSNSLIELLLEGHVESHQLYLALKKDGKSKLNLTDNNGGLGSIFRKEKRHKLISSAFKIDDTIGSETASVANVDELVSLAKAFKKGNIHGIKQNKNKNVICLALILNETHDDKLKRKVSDQLEKLYLDSDYKYHKEASKVLNLIKEKSQVKPVLVELKDEHPTPSLLEKTEKQIMSEDKTSIQLFAPLQASLEETNHTINLVNALRRLLIDNIDTWKNKTTGRVFFFGGKKTEHPDPTKKGQFLRVPDGIAKMLGCLKSNNLLADDVTDIEVAKSTLQELSRVALERLQLGDRSCTRSKETNRLYALLSSLTTGFNSSDMKAIKNIKPANAEINFGNVKLEFIEEISSILNNPSKSTVIGLKK